MRLVRSVNYRKVCIIFALVLSTAGAFAQDPEFSQFFANPIYTNPAFAGGSTVGRGVLNYRSQWPGISGTFRTYSASFDEHYAIINGGIGFILTNDEAGVGTFKTLAFSGMYSYQIRISKTVTIRAAVQGGYTQKSIDFSKLTFFDQLAAGQGIVRNTAELPPANPIYYWTVAAGGVLYTNHFYGGVAVHNMNEPVVSFYSSKDAVGESLASMHLARRITVHAGGIIPLVKSRDESKSSNLWPNILYMQQGPSTQLNLGVYYNKGPLVLGTYFRQNANINSDAVILLAGFRLPKMRFGFSYDATVSEARYGARQSYEISMAFELRKRAHKKTFRNIRCPEF